jgi:hypothetical protein
MNEEELKFCEKAFLAALPACIARGCSEGGLSEADEMKWVVGDAYNFALTALEERNWQIERWDNAKHMTPS